MYKKPSQHMWLTGFFSMYHGDKVQVNDFLRKEVEMASVLVKWRFGLSKLMVLQIFYEKFYEFGDIEEQDKST